MDFLRSFTRGADDLLNNPNVDPKDAAEAVTNSMIKMTQYQDLRQSAGTVIRGNYLFNLATAITNFVGNMGRALEIPVARLAAGKPREAADLLIGYSKAFNKVFPRFIGGFRNIDIELDTIHHKKFDIARGVFKTEPGEKVDKYLNRPVNAFLTFPQNFQRGVDEGFATLFEHAQLEVMLNRIKRGMSDSEFVRKFVSEKGTSPEQFMKDVELAIAKGEDAARAAAKAEGRLVTFDPLWKYVKDESPELMAEIEEFSRYGTFRTKLGSSLIDTAASSMSNFVNKVPEFSPILPFIITPTNIAKFGAGYVPGLGAVRMRQGLKDIKELENQVIILNEKLSKAKTPKAAKNISDRIDKINGEIRFKKDLNRDLIGQQILGIGLIGTAYYMVDNNMLTGAYPQDAARRTAMQNAGIPEFGIKFGNKWWSYAGIEPLHTVLGLVANSFDTIKQAQLQGKDPIQIGIGIGNTIKAAFLDKTFTKQLSDMLLAVQEPDRKAEALAVAYTNPFLPSFMYQIARAQDQVQREIKDPEFVTWAFNNIKQRIPGLRETLPARYNLLGEPAKVGSLGGVITGRKIEPADQTEVQKALANPNLRLLNPSRNLYGTELTGEQYSRMSAAMGQVTAQLLAPLVSAPGFKALPEYTKAFLISALVSEVRSDLRLAMIRELNLSEEQRQEIIQKELLKRGINPFEKGLPID